MKATLSLIEASFGVVLALFSQQPTGPFSAAGDPEALWKRAGAQPMTPLTGIALVGRGRRAEEGIDGHEPFGDFSPRLSRGRWVLPSRADVPPGRWRVRLRALSMVGVGDRTEQIKRIDAHQADICGCLLEAGPSAWGRLQLRLDVDDQGQTHAGEVTLDTIGDSTAAECVAGEARDWILVPAAPAATTTVTVTIDLDPDS